MAMQCGQAVRLLGSGLIEYSALLQSMANVENYVESEKQVWEEFRMRMEGPNSPLPRESGFNLLLIAEVAIHLVDVLDSENLVGSPEY